MIKLFASDLDGTLLNIMHDLDGPIRAAIREVTASGAHFAVATGRSLRSNRDFGFEGLDVEAIGANGAVIYGRDGRLLKSFPMDPAVVEELLRAFPTVCFECVSPEITYITGTYEQQQGNFRRDNPFKRLVMRGMSSRGQEMLRTCVFEQPVAEILRHEVCKINTRVPDPALEAELHAYLAERADALENGPFDPVMFEISTRGVNKGSAVAWLAGYLGISEDEVAVYGDGGNDVAMLRRFHHAYATRCACVEAKEASLEVVGSHVLYAVPRHLVRTVRAQRREPAYTQL